MTRTDIEALEKQAEGLAGTEILVETNSGTYGATEACRAIGTGDPRYADYRIFVRVADGRRRVEGCNPDEAPGYSRKMWHDLRHLQNRLSTLRNQIKHARRKHYNL